MKVHLSILLLIIFYNTAFSQFNKIWTSGSIASTYASGYLSFEKSGNTWQQRFYLIDSNKFQICTSGLSVTPQYTYNFSAEEKLAGSQIYSLGTDLNGDNIMDFYVMQYIGTSSDYRSAFKIVNITNNATIFQLNSTNYSYSYPVLADIDNDGYLEMIITKYDYPYQYKYYYEVYSTGISGNNEANKQPVSFQLKQNYPNPFNPTTTIDYSVENPSHVKIEVYDIAGKLVTTLVDKEEAAGNHSIVWNGKGKDTRAASGVYFYQLTVGSRTEAKKMILLK